MQKKIFSAIVMTLMFSNSYAQKNSDNTNFILIKDRKSIAVFILTKKQEEITNLNGPCGTPGTISSNINDFNDDLKECTAGIALPVLETDDGKTPMIRFAIESRPLPDEDRFAITFPDSRTMLITGSTFSVRWALNYVLENFAGVRYLTRSKNGTHYPQISFLAIPRIEIQKTSSFNLHRDAYIVDAFWYKRSYSKYRVPNNHELPAIAFPVKTYMAENTWPEFIFPTHNGKKFLPYLPKENPVFKTAGQYYSAWQPCMTSPETIAEAVKNICEYFEKNPERGAISLAINDMGGFCCCDNCRPLGGINRTITGHLEYSDLYYTWLNTIVENVTKKYPDKFFGCLAYREVITPPSFKLHKNIVPFITFDAYGCMDPEVKASRIDLIKKWGAKAANLGWWDYAAGSGVYDLPRVYFGLQQEMMKIAYSNNIRGLFIEAEGGWIDDGPKMYLYNKLMWNINADLETVLKEWYEACVGKSAAPYLAEYFKWWGKFWRNEAVKTDWFQNSKNATYLNMGFKGYLNAIGRDDMPKLRALMEKVSEQAAKNGDQRQQIRANWLMREFEYSEACIYASGAQIFPHSGAVENAGQAVDYLNSLPKAVKYDVRKNELLKAKKDDPDIGRGFGTLHVPSEGITGALSKIASLISDPKVLEGLKKALLNMEIPFETRGLIEILVKLESNAPVNNLLYGCSFENSRDTEGWTGGQISDELADRGDSSFKADLMPGHYVMIKSTFPVKPGPYLVSAAIFIQQDNPDVEERVKMGACAQYKKGGQNFNAWETAETYITPGIWTRLTLVANVPPDRETFGLYYFAFKNYVSGDTAFIDDIVIVPLVPQDQVNTQKITALRSTSTGKVPKAKSNIRELDLVGNFNTLWTRNWICYDQDAVKQVSEGRSGQCLEVVTAEKTTIFRALNFLPLIIGKDTIKVSLYAKGKGSFSVRIPVYNKEMKNINDIGGVPNEKFDIDSPDEWVKNDFTAKPVLSDDSTSDPSGKYTIQIVTYTDSTLYFDDLTAFVERDSTERPFGKTVLPEKNRSDAVVSKQKTAPIVLNTASFEQWLLLEVSLRKESEKFLELSDNSVQLIAADKIVQFFNPIPIPAVDGGTIEFTFVANGNGQGQVGIIAYADNQWTSTEGRIFKNFSLENKSKEYSFSLPIKGSKIKTIRAIIGAGPTSTVRYSDLSIVVK